MYRAELSLSPSFAPLLAHADIAPNAVGAISAPLEATLGPFPQGACIFHRIFSANLAGLSAPLQGPACIRALDGPSHVTHVQVRPAPLRPFAPARPDRPRHAPFHAEPDAELHSELHAELHAHGQVEAISEEQIVLRWGAPADSGDGTPDGVPISRYVVQIFLPGGALAQTVDTPPAKRFVLLDVTPGVDYRMRISAITAVSPAPSADALTVLVTYSGTAVRYYVPLDFFFSATVTTSVVRTPHRIPQRARRRDATRTRPRRDRVLVAAQVGSTSSFTITPGSKPYVPAVVHISSSDPSSAQPTPKIIFAAGSTAPQTVVVSHRRRGNAVLLFRAEGANYAGLDTTVEAETIAAEAVQ